MALDSILCSSAKRLRDELAIGLTFGLGTAELYMSRKPRVRGAATGDERLAVSLSEMSERKRPWG